jgi:PAS domain S-box-containing protein
MDEKMTLLLTSRKEVPISYEQYCKFIEEIPLPIVISSIGDNRCLHMNQPAAILFEVPDHNFLEGYTYDYYVDPTRRQQLLDCLRAAGQIQNFEVLLKTKSGHPFYASISATLTVFKDNLAVCSVFNDNTDRKKAEEEVKNATRKIDQIIDFLPDATFVIDKSGKVIAWNRAIELLTGIPQAEMIAKGDYEYSIPFYGERRPIMIDLVLHPDTNLEKSNYDVFHRKGDTLFAECHVPGAFAGKCAYLMGTASPLFDEGGNIVGAIESLRDVTGHKRAVEALWESEDKLHKSYESLRSILDSLDSMVYVADFDSY